MGVNLMNSFEQQHVAEVSVVYLPIALSEPCPAAM